MKIDASKWKVEEIEIQERDGDFLAHTQYHGGTTSEMNGRSKTTVGCGFCLTSHEVYIWSFHGGGKRCSNCGALICTGLTFAEKSKIKNDGIFK